MTNFQIYDIFESLFSSVALKITVDVLMKFHITDSTFSDNIFMLKHTKYYIAYLTEYIVIKRHLYTRKTLHTICMINEKLKIYTTCNTYAHLRNHLVQCIT